MKRIVILGCENSHANNFLNAIKEDERYSDYDVLGVYSEDREAAEKLKETFGVPVLDSYDECVGKVDGVIITARHGANHYKYAKPYIASGVPMFIDKPITVDTAEVVEFMRELRAAGVKITGGSSLGQADEIRKLKADAINGVGGKTLGGVVRAPIQTDSVHGGIYFYAQHLVEMVFEIFGRYPNSVRACKVADQTTVIFRYDEYDVVGVYLEHIAKYYAVRFTKDGTDGGTVASSKDWFKREFADFNALLDGGEQQISYDDFISPVFAIRAIEKSLESGNEEAIEKYKV